MEKNLSDLVSSTWDEGDAASDQHSTSQTHVEKKLKLFGFEVPYDHPRPDHDPPKTNHYLRWDESSVNSSKKFECQYCLREFVNSQALGGHQNAHKRERLKKKRMQLEARSARINCYLQPYIHNYNLNLDFHHHDPADDQLIMESSISFSQLQSDDDEDDTYTQTLSFKDSCNFTTLTCSSRSGKHRPFAINASPVAALVDFKQKSKSKSKSKSPSSSSSYVAATNLDLQLTLSSSSII